MCCPREGQSYSYQKYNEELISASFSKRVLMRIVSYENEISFTCKLISFSYEFLCPRPRFDIQTWEQLAMGYLQRSSVGFLVKERNTGNPEDKDEKQNKLNPEITERPRFEPCQNGSIGSSHFVMNVLYLL